MAIYKVKESTCPTHPNLGTTPDLVVDIYLTSDLLSAQSVAPVTPRLVARLSAVKLIFPCCEKPLSITRSLALD